MRLTERLRDYCFTLKLYGAPVKIVYGMPRNYPKGAIACLIRRRNQYAQVTHARIHIAKDFCNSDRSAERQESIRHEIHHLRICEIDLQRDLGPIFDEVVTVADYLYGRELLDQYMAIALSESEIWEEAFAHVADAFVKGARFKCSSALRDVIEEMTQERGSIAALNVAIPIIGFVLAGWCWFM